MEEVLKITWFLASVVVDRGENTGRDPGLRHRDYELSYRHVEFGCL